MTCYSPIPNIRGGAMVIMLFNINITVEIMKKIHSMLFAAALMGGALAMASCSNKAANDDKSAQKEQTTVQSDQGNKPVVVVDKSGDSTLQAMIKDVAPKFKQGKYEVAGKGTAIEYNLYAPENVDKAKKYPLVVFIADASTAGKDVTAPLTQGYGALVWATQESQRKNPCYVLVPQLSQVGVNDAYEHTPEVDDVIGLVNKVVADNQVDPSRIYSTGQSMGGMMSMYYDVAYPDLFAASIFVDSHWDASKFGELVKHKFVWFIAGENGKAYPTLKPLEDAAEKAGRGYTYSEWSAKLPQARQNELAATMLEKGAPINIFEFETGSVLPDGVEGMDHMYSFDYAYRNSAVRDWLFKQSK